MGGLIAYVDKRSRENGGKPLYPHIHKDNKYVASHTRYEADYIRVETEAQLEALVRAGYGARMSNKDIGAAPSLKISENIHCTGSSDLESELKQAALNADLDVESITKRRTEQTLLRSFLLQGKLIASCVICRYEFPENMLVAAHIKKRSECTDDEKRDFSKVAALMCKLGCDDFFEKGYIYVAEGIVRKNARITTTARIDEALSFVVGNEVSGWENSKDHFEWHFEQWHKGA